MTKTLDKTDLVRLAWLTELRRQGDRQCTGADFPKGKVCALGLLAEIVGFEWVDTLEPEDYGPLGCFAGLSWDQTQDVWKRNDGVNPDEMRPVPYHKHTFAEIADVVEGWFK